MPSDDRNLPESSSENDERTRLTSGASAVRDVAPEDEADKTRHRASTTDSQSPNQSPDDATRALMHLPLQDAQDPPSMDLSAPDRAAPDGQGEQTNDKTQFTEYNPAGGNSSSTGFEKAKAIANKALASKGKILKKRFVLEEILGKGGMGVVYKARDLRKVEAEDPNPFVVAKVLGQEFKDHPDAFVVLQQEAAKSQRIAHPNIVTVHDFDRDGNTIYLTMELLEGRPLDDLIRSYKDEGIPKEKVVPLFKDLCAALSYAHARQLIHADFKPGNVFISEDGTAKVLDFGIARAASKESHKYKYDVGSLGALTPAYATIEMVQGKAPTFSDDVYALACVLYEMLTGKHPYQGKSADLAFRERLRPERIDALNTKEWKALSRGLALKREERFSTVDEFLHAFLPKRKSLAFKIAAALLIAAICGLGWLGYKENQSRKQLQITVAEKLRQAQACYDRQDYACAIEQSLVVSNLAPDNVEANNIYANATQALEKKRLTKRVKGLLGQASFCFDEKDFSCAKLKIEELLTLAPDNSEAKSLQSRILQATHTHRVAGIILQGKECLDRRDLNCALIFLNKGRSIDAEHDLVKSLAAKIKAFQLEIQTRTREREKAIAAFIKKAKACRAQNDYDCTIAQANRALQLDGNNFDAIRLKSEAELSKRQQIANKKKVGILVQEGRECLKKKKYNCAVGKADSALDIIPDNAAALQLRKAAIHEQNKLKSSIKIN